MTDQTPAPETPKEQSPPRPRWKKKRWWAVAIIGLFLFWVYFIPRFPFGSPWLYTGVPQAVLDQPIAYLRLSDQTIDPFLQFEDIPEHWADPVAEYPSVRECLIRREATAEMHDLRLINWDKIGSIPELEVCIWRIFSSLGTPDRVETWMEFHGLDPSTGIHSSRGKSQHIVNGSRSYDTDGHFWPTTGFMRFGQRLFFYIHGQGISARWEDGKLRNVQHSYTIL